MATVVSQAGTPAAWLDVGPPALNGGGPSEGNDKSSPKTPSETCNGGKATTDTKTQGKAFESLQKFDVSTGNNSTLVSAHVATAFIPAWVRTDSPDNAHFYNALGVDISTAVPVSSASLGSYAKQALLMTKGGVANVYFSAAGRDVCDAVYDWEPRRTAVDHAYVIHTPATGNELIAYVLDGIGIRAVKTALSGNGYGALGTAYLGVGFDGPLFSFNGESVGPRAVDDTTGLMSLEVYVAENAINPHTLDTLFGTRNAPSSFANYGASLRLGLPGRFFLSIDYSKAIRGYARTHLGDVAIVSFGYNRPTQSSSTSAQSSGGQ